MKKTTVCIVGAGPTGLVAALTLQRYGVSVCLLDKKSGPTQTSNALALHARSIEMLADLGLAKALHASAQKINRVILSTERAVLASLDFTRLQSPYPYSLGIPQSETEACLITALKATGLDILWQTEVVDVSQEKDHVRLLCADGQSIIANWVLGCDGYHSRVSQSLALFDRGDALPQNFVMLDGQLESNWPKDAIQVVFSPTGLLGVFPMKHFSRLIADLPADEQAALTPAFFEGLAKTRAGQTIRVTQAHWTSRFRIHERLVQHYRKQRVFLLGDAAHVHSPAGGQGMNTGMQDAYNLAWKLAFVCQKQAAVSLLKTYARERRPVAAGVIHAAGRMTRLAGFRQPVLRGARNILIKYVLSNFLPKFAPVMAGLAIRYSHSRLSQGEKTETLAPGNRAPDAPFAQGTLFEVFQGGHFTVLNFGRTPIPPLPSAYFREVVIPKEAYALRKIYGMPHHVCLVRPDGYIAYIGRTAKLPHYLRKAGFVGCG